MSSAHDHTRAELDELANALEGDFEELEQLTPRIEALRKFLVLHPRGPADTSAVTPDEVPAPVEPEPAPDRALDRRSAVAVERRWLGVAVDLGWLRRRWIPVVTIAVAIVGVGAFVAPWLVSSWSSQASGFIAIETNPPGVQVILDGVPRGVSPLSVEVSPGDHLVELLTESGRRRIPTTVTAGSRVVQVLELPTGAAAVGTMQVRTDPPGISVTVDGVAAGISPVTLTGLTPGAHTVDLGSDTGRAVTEQVVIEGGKTASLVVSMAAPTGVAAAGWISLAAPADVQVYERGRLVGNSRIERIMLPVGRHELEMVSEDLGYRQSRAVQVTAGRVSQVTLDWPRGSVALNALPWAEVFIDGQKVGDTPLANVAVPIGRREVVFRHPSLGEERRSVTVRADQPTKVAVDLRAR